MIAEGNHIAVRRRIVTESGRLGTRARTSLALGGKARSHAVPVLQAFAVTALVIPSDGVIKAIGAVGFPAALIGMFAFAALSVAVLLGFHDPRLNRHPMRAVLGLLWITSLVSYVLIDRGALTVHESQGADRFLMKLAVITGVALVGAECLNSTHDLRRVLRAMSWGGAFAGLVAALQFKLKLDLTPYLKLPAFSRDVSADFTAIVNRGGLNRAAGTALSPIELGVVSAMLLPLATWLAIYDTERTARVRWTPVVLIAIGIAASVSRSAIIAVAITTGFFVVLMPVRQRLAAFVAVPLVLVAMFVTAHGLLGTLGTFLGYGTSDPSIAHRVDNYAYVEQLVRQAPWFGHGGGTYIATADDIHVFDNQYLTTAVELGLVGLAVLAAMFMLPMIAALSARRRTGDPELRLLCAGLAGGALAGGVSSATFDSLDFPMFYCVYALVLALIGASWRLAVCGDSRRGISIPRSSADTPLPSVDAVLTTRQRLQGG